MQNFHSLSVKELADWCVDQGEPAFKAKQVFDWVYKKRKADFEEMTNLSKTFRTYLAGHFSLKSMSLEKVQESKDGQTIKFLWRLQDDKLVESVLIIAPGRRTVCVSSQVGCPARCAFCASGKEGLIRNLTAVEIFSQVYAIEVFLAEKEETVSHIVYMGMGEPLENYEAVKESIGLLCDPLRLHLSPRRITISTVGVVEGIRKLTTEDLGVNLVLSLHAPNQHIRKKIIPYARRYDLEDVLSAMRDFSLQTKRNLTYEYTLISGINDREEHAKELGKLIQNDSCTVNLIPYNPVEGLHLKRPEKENIEMFREVLENMGVVVTWRYTKGKDIAAACGQLALQKEESNLVTIGSSQSRI